MAETLGPHRGSARAVTTALHWGCRWARSRHWTLPTRLRARWITGGEPRLCSALKLAALIMMRRPTRYPLRSTNPILLGSKG
jgi:hypothetical protein